MGDAPPADLDEAVRLFAVPPDDVAPLRAAHEAVCRDPALAAWVAAVAGRLRDAMGEPSPGPTLEPRPEGEAGVTAYLPVLAFAAVLPDLLAFHASLGVPADVTALTLADVGRMLARNRVWFGEPGLGDELGGWLTRHLHGALVQLGRLQYERVRLGDGPGLQLRMLGFPCGPGDLTLNLHIPGVGGPLSAAAVDGSLAAARAFFRKRFADEHYALVTCHSWLLDPQLRDVLPAGANLATFQQRFTLGPPHDGDGDVSVRKFVFGDVDTPLADLPQDTSLQRAVVGHLQDGRHWHVHSGWLPWR